MLRYFRLHYTRDNVPYQVTYAATGIGHAEDIAQVIIGYDLDYDALEALQRRPAPTMHAWVTGNKRDGYVVNITHDASKRGFAGVSMLTLNNYRCAQDIANAIKARMELEH